MIGDHLLASSSALSIQRADYSNHHRSASLDRNGPFLASKLADSATTINVIAVAPERVITDTRRSDSFDLGRSLPIGEQLVNIM